MKRSIFIALGLALAAAGWILSGQLGERERPAQANSSPAATGKIEPRLPTVRVRAITAQQRSRRIVVNGRTEASRIVTLRAEISGRIVAVGASEGARVRKGDIIARLSTEDRKVRLAEAEAVLRQRRIEYDAARKLFKKGFRADTKLAEARANLGGAQARLEKTRLDLNRTIIRAPFDGILEDRPVELGAFLKVGDAIAKLVDLDPILVVGNVSERDIGGVTLGSGGTAVLYGGQVISGRVRYIASVADSATRTFRVELEVANPAGKVRDGVTSEIRLPLPAVRAHLVSPALLSLSAEGTVGVKLVNDANRVEFVPVTIVSDTAAGVWLDGLPEKALLISVGHEFVKTGDLVEPVFATGSAP